MVAASWSSLQQVSGHARSLEEPCQWPGSSLDCGFRGSNVRLLHFFFKTTLPGEDWQGLLWLKYFTKTFGLRNCNANCIAKIFPGLRKIRWDKGTSPNAQVLPLR